MKQATLNVGRSKQIARTLAIFLPMAVLICTGVALFYQSELMPTHTGNLMLNGGVAGGTTLVLILILAVIWRMTSAQMAVKNARSRISHLEAHLQSLVQASPDLIWLKDENGVYLSCNHAFERLYAAKQNDIVGKTDYDFVGKDKANTLLANDRAAINAGKARINHEWFTFAEAGRRALMETTKTPIKTPDGQFVGVLGIARDITKQKQIEEELQKSQNLLNSLTAHLPGIVYQFRLAPDGQQSFLFVGDAIRSIYGVTPQEVYRDTSVMLSFIHPEDFMSMQSSMRKSALSLQIWQHEFRTVHPNLGVRWMKNSSMPEKQQDGSIIWYGIIMDIHERKLTEGGVQLASMVYQNSTEAIIVTDADNKIIAVNPAFEVMTGYSADEVINQSPSILKSGIQEPAFYESMWDELRRDGKWQGEVWNRRKDGSSYPARLTISTTYKKNGSPHYYVGLSSDITQRKESEQLIWKQANFDPLTELPNRNMFREHIDLTLKKSVRSGLPTALILLDLDDFKDVNDTLGHDIGDLLLQETAARLCSCVRDTDVVARLGGDEFTVILGEIPDQTIVERVAQSILQTLSKPFQLKGELIHISASIGITFFPKDGAEIEALVKNADQAMYAAKKLGRNRSCYFDPSMQNEAQARMHTISDLRTVLDGSQFALQYQPIVDLATGEINSAEALIRWRHPVRGLINPADFIQVAEETGMIIEIGNWVFHEAATQAARWRMLHDQNFQVSINMSPVQFRNDDGFADTWFEHLQKIGTSGHAMMIEITEGLLLDANASVSSQLHAFRAAGVRVAIDDFGTGYSSLAYLKKFDIDYIKIDRSFVANLKRGSSDMALCEAIIVMAHTLGMKVIAEGIESIEQLTLLTSVGCDFGQGFLFSRPVNSSEFDTILQSMPRNILDGVLLGSAEKQTHEIAKEKVAQQSENVLPLVKR